ncbi:Hypothetical predicted protein, partial [Mytilus galloprovincialis]
MGRFRQGFLSCKQKQKIESIRKGQNIRQTARTVLLDHAYTTSYSSSSYKQPDLSNFIHEEVVDENNVNITSDDSWRNGRRVVELGVLADHLAACKQCGLPLSLQNCLNITTCGLAAVLKVLCVNQSCRNINAIPTGKQHNRIWDVNTKLATATECLMNGKKKLEHAVLEEIAEKSMKEWTEKEKSMMTKECSGNEDITVAVDAGWQKRGSGRSYDSLTGHCSMIGTRTGMILDYSLRSRTCRVCVTARRMKKIPKVHTCRKNYSGSSKAMEADMVVQMVADARIKGTNIMTIVGDEDATTIARLRNKVDKSIIKLSDSNHVKKTLGKSLFALRNKHSRLTTKIIYYFMKCFNFLVAQARGRPEEISKNLPALSKHPFGDHTSCNPGWCQSFEDSSMKFRSLPYGKPLKDKQLQASLSTLFSNYITQSEKLANLESTQGNESFNNTVASKAPKNRHYGILA